MAKKRNSKQVRISLYNPHTEDNLTYILEHSKHNTQSRLLEDIVNKEFLRLKMLHHKKVMTSFFTKRGKSK